MMKTKTIFYTVVSAIALVFAALAAGAIFDWRW